MNDEEIWLPVVGYEDTHLVSNMGTVKALERKWEMPNGGFRNKPEQVLSPIKHTHGYLRVNMHSNGIRKFRPIHRLVAEAFIPNPENKPEVNHRFGKKFDNRVSELEWATKSENTKHAYDIGLNSPTLGRRKQKKISPN